MFERGESSRTGREDTTEAIDREWEAVMAAQFVIPGYVGPQLGMGEITTAQEVPCRDVAVVSEQPYGPGRRMFREPRFPGEQPFLRPFSRSVRGGVFSTGIPDSDDYSDSIEEEDDSEDTDEDEEDDDDAADDARAEEDADRDEDADVGGDDTGYDAGSEPEPDQDGEDAETDPEEGPVEDGMDADMAPESEPEEDIPQDSPVFYQPGGFPDGMGSTAEDIIEDQAERILELEGQVLHLEEQDAVHQHTEDQYRDLAYQTIGERDQLTVQLAARDLTITTLEGQVQRGQQSAERTGTLTHQVVARSTTLSQQLEGAEIEAAGLHEEVSALQAELEGERARRSQAEQALLQAQVQLQRLGMEPQHRERRTDSFEDTLTAALAGVRRRVYEQMAQQEIRRAVRRRRD